MSPPKLVSVRPIDAPAPTNWGKPVTFPSPRGDATLWCSDPSEFAMGASAWRVELRRGRRVLRDWHDGGDPWRLTPWSPDGARIAFPLTGRSGERLVLAAADGTLLAAPPHSPQAWIADVRWAPTAQRWLVTTRDGAAVFDDDGREVARARWSDEPLGDVAGGWLASSTTFWIVSTDPEGSLRFYAAESGRLVDAVALDPTDVVPYHRDQYARVHRETWSLELGRGTHAVGGLLDVWGEVRADDRTGELLLSTIRPVGPPTMRDDGVWGAQAEQRWVAVEIGE